MAVESDAVRNSLLQDFEDLIHRVGTDVAQQSVNPALAELLVQWRDELGAFRTQLAQELKTIESHVGKSHRSTEKIVSSLKQLAQGLDATLGKAAETLTSAHEQAQQIETSFRRLIESSNIDAGLTDLASKASTLEHTCNSVNLLVDRANGRLEDVASHLAMSEERFNELRDLHRTRFDALDHALDRTLQRIDEVVVALMAAHNADLQQFNALSSVQKQTEDGVNSINSKMEVLGSKVIALENELTAISDRAIEDNQRAARRQWIIATAAILGLISIMVRPLIWP